MTYHRYHEYQYMVNTMQKKIIPFIVISGIQEKRVLFGYVFIFIIIFFKTVFSLFLESLFYNDCIQTLHQWDSLAAFNLESACRHIPLKQHDTTA